MARLDEMIAVNQRSALKADPRAASVEAKRELCIVTCHDPRLTRFFSDVLGIERGDAVLIRLPGANLLSGHADALRAVAAAVYINQVNEVLLMGHTDCGTTRVDASAVASRMQREGLPLSAMPGGPREFLGAIGDLRSALKASAAALRSAPYLPRTLLVHCAILDIKTGVLEVLERGEDVAAPAEAVAGDTLAYRPGPGGLPINPLGEGLTLLNGAVHTLFSGDGALAANTDAFATPQALASTLPPGWADGTASLKAAPIGSSVSALDAVGVIGAGPAVTSTIDLGFTAVNLTPGVDVTSFSSPQRARPLPSHAHQPHVHPPPPLPPPKKRAPAPRARVADVEVVEVEERRRPTTAVGSPELQANVDRVRDFYRIEFPLERRRSLAKLMVAVVGSGGTTDQLLKMVLKPILESGQKRYKVIDEMIAIKGYVAPLPPDEAAAVLTMLLE